MTSGRPIVRQIAWVSLIPQIGIMLVLIILTSMIFGSSSPATDIVILFYLLYPLISRRLIAHNHRTGIKLFKSGAYAPAILEFEKSYEFFTKHRWIDKYRFIILLSSSKISYTEMALLNIAFCHSQLGDGPKAKQYYEKTLSQFPDSEMAKSALKMMNSFATEKEPAPFDQNSPFE